MQVVAVVFGQPNAAVRITAAVLCPLDLAATRLTADNAKLFALGLPTK